jgi:predicted KAP-like P-loop ATPase
MILYGFCAQQSPGKKNEPNGICIVTDEAITDALDFDNYSQAISNIITNSVPRFTVGIYGGWGTGKTTMMQMIQNHLRTKNTTEKYKNNILTIWFDSWRYENEQFSALVPFVRTIILHLEEYTQKLGSEGNPRKATIKNLANKFRKVGEAILQSSTANAEVGYSVTKASFETDIGKAIDNYKSEGSFFKNEGRVRFYKHISDRVKEELENIRVKKDTKNFRLVIFIDDLDRCTPERALEILESIKTFFDIEGIIFVIGIDPSTIDPIIKTKYGVQSKIDGVDSKIDGMKYLEKIVQIPYTMPLWNRPRLSDVITNLMAETHLPNDVIKKVLETKTQDLIMKATELNPRDVKRFINSIVISQVSYPMSLCHLPNVLSRYSDTAVFCSSM